MRFNLELERSGDGEVFFLSKALQISPGAYDERVFQGLDFVVAEARKLDFGGRPQYVEWARSSGVQISSNDDFYTNPIVKGYYKNHIQVIKLK
ncbi:Glycoside hydrolase, catalytic domain-containing protein [Cynara cardunculus var. scolymus]|uniref:Glycoside hydrolase, catalytic domain-containing protein n=1 Tax=Cynara cardunculus var. scolymus TaxID=59895 RepID=A0A103VC06_CYNCS|nr:Glycoside hydrolase, catalytic domain-containing protein [Cynara cardunculus var. scolymus]